MENDGGRFTVRSKVWIEDEAGKVVFGLGRYRILRTVERTGSLLAAAKELRMSYRAIWCRIRSSEERLDRTLVTREGKGSRLTGFARTLLVQFDELQARVSTEADEVFGRTLADSLARPAGPARESDR